MSVLWILVGFSIAVAGGFLAAYLWAVRSGQYDDPHTPAVRILFEDQNISAKLDHPHQPAHQTEGTVHDGDAEDPVR